MKIIYTVLVLYSCFLVWSCSGRKVLTHHFLKSSNTQASQLVNLSASIKDELVLIPVVQSTTPLTGPDSASSYQPLVIPKKSAGKIVSASGDTIKVAFDENTELAFCRNPGHMQKNINDDAYYLCMQKVRHMDGTKSYVIKSGKKLFLPSINCWSCKLYVETGGLGK